MEQADVKVRPFGARVKDGERGAVIVEATISLSVFMFAMFILLNVVQIAYVQSRISVALYCATKEIAEYTHIYFATGMDEAFSGSGGKSSELFGEVGDFLQEIGGELGSIDEEIGQLVTAGGSAASETSITDLIKNFAGEVLVLALMDKNLGDGTGGSAETFKRKHHIERIDLLESSVLEGSNHIYYRVKYRVKVVQLLKLDYGFDMSAWAYADAWSGK